MQGAWHREQLGKRLLMADGASANTKPAPGVHTGGHACGPCSRLMGCPDSPVTDEETRLLPRGTEAGESRGEAGAGVREGSETTGLRTATALFNRTRPPRAQRESVRLSHRCWLALLERAADAWTVKTDACLFRTPCLGENCRAGAGGARVSRTGAQGLPLGHGSDTWGCGGLEMRRWAVLGSGPSLGCGPRPPPGSLWRGALGGTGAETALSPADGPQAGGPISRPRALPACRRCPRV